MLSINLREVTTCNELDYLSDLKEKEMYASVLYRPILRDGFALRCKLLVDIGKSFCGQGFLSMQKYSNSNVFIHSVDEIFKLTEQQCRALHNGQTIKINFGTDSLELGGNLGSSITKGFLYKSVLHDNGTCMGIPENKTVFLSQNQPQIVTSTGWNAG